MATKKKKRVLIISDLHCGHRAGLTPPEWQSEIKPGSKTQHNKFAILQKEIWDWYAKTVDSLRPISRLIVNGDAIDGKGEKSGSSEAKEADRLEQIEMAAACIKYVKAKKVLMTYGTPYHTGRTEDFEALVAERVHAVKIGSHEWPIIEGTKRPIFDIKHKVGRSQIPHGVFTAPARARLHNVLWAEAGLQPKADIFIRSHVHYHAECSGPGWRVITTPALQGFGDKFGARECEAIVHVGLIYIDVFEDGSYQWTYKLCQAESLKAEPLIF
jgi:hypothetical protein